MGLPGEYLANQAHGRGTKRWVSGARYQGEWKRGKEHGFGTWTSGETGDGFRPCQYEGGFRDGLPHGEGRYDGSRGELYQGEWRRGRQDGRGAWFGADGEVYDGMWSAGRATGGAIHRRVAGTAVPGVSGDNGRVLVWQYRERAGGPRKRERVEDVLKRLADAELRGDVAGLVRAAGRGHFDSVAERVRAGCDVHCRVSADAFAAETWYAWYAKSSAMRPEYSFATVRADDSIVHKEELGPVDAVCLAVERLRQEHPLEWYKWSSRDTENNHDKTTTLMHTETDRKELSGNEDGDHDSGQDSEEAEQIVGGDGYVSSGTQRKQPVLHSMPAGEQPPQEPPAPVAKLRALRRVLTTLVLAGVDANSAIVSSVRHRRAAAVSLLADTIPAGAQKRFVNGIHQHEKSSAQLT